MTGLRLFAIVLIFALATVAWMILGTSVFVRTESLNDKAGAEVASLWGPPVLEQNAPFWALTASDAPGAPTSTLPTSSTLTANIRHNNRYKGLLWFNTYSVDFAGRYRVPAVPQAPDGVFVFPLPGGVAYDNLAIAVDGEPVPLVTSQLASRRLVVPMNCKSPHEVTVTYTTGGQDAWLYAPTPTGTAAPRSAEDPVVVSTGSGQLSAITNFSLTVTTNFEAIDYPTGTRSPTTPARHGDNGGMVAEWKYANTVSHQAMGVSMPSRLNAGPIVARMSFFAPVCLLFFFVSLFAIVVLKKAPLHPMHYLFIAAGFFAFHILLAYLADLMSIQLAFWICAAVSVFLVVSYMRLVAGVKFAVVFVGLAQIIFLVGFSYAFFWTGRTGLLITIGAIAMLFVLMQATGRVKWAEVFARSPRNDRVVWRAIPTPPSPTAPQD